MGGPDRPLSQIWAEWMEVRLTEMSPGITPG